MLDDFRRIDIKWEKASDKIYESIKVMSSDETGRKLAVQILDEGRPIDTLNVELDLYWETESNKNRGLDEFRVADAENSIFEMYFTTGLLSNVGTLKSNLVIRDEKGVITSNTFYIEVLEGIDWDATQSSDSFSSLTEIMKTVESISAQEESRVLKEAERIRDERVRVSAETGRIAKESERATAESERGTSETARRSSESLRDKAEKERIGSESKRSQAETSRTENESVRNLSESSRVAEEKRRVSSESNRDVKEGERTSKESIRVSSEAKRVSDETKRVAGETSREKDEKLRNDNELERMAKEEIRIASETKRISSENIRKESEADRVGSEKERASSEVSRKESEVIRNSKEEQRIASELTRVGSEDSRSFNEAERINKDLAREAVIKDFESRVLAGEFDGLDLEFEWKETELGVRKEGTVEYTYVDLKGETGEVDNLTSKLITDALGYTPLDESNFVDTITTVNGKTGSITKADIVALGIPAQDTSYVAGSNIAITDNTISVTGQLGLTESEVKAVKVDKAVDADTVTGHTVGKSVPADAKFTDTIVDVSGKADKTELHSHDNKLVLDKFTEVDGELLYDGEKLSGGGGSGIPLGNVTNLNTSAELFNKIRVKWIDPEDIMFETSYLAKWEGTQLRRKEGTYPVDMRDGTLLVDNKVRNQYSVGYLDEDLTEGVTYYYALFPYTDGGTVTVDPSNRGSATAFNKYERTAPSAPTVTNVALLKATVTSDSNAVVSLDKVEWHTSPHTFEGLIEGRSYTSYAKVLETTEYYESAFVTGSSFTAIAKSPQTAPPAPSISNEEFDRVTVSGEIGTEVRMGTGLWYPSPHTFTGLTEETSYTFYARRAETALLLPSPSSSGKVFTTPAELKIYGFEIDESNTNPKTAVTYIGDAIGMTPASGNNGTFKWGSWEPFIKEISKPVVVKAGVEQYDLNYDDYTKKATSGASVLTGADGDVFTKLQHLHIKYEKITNGHRWLLASKPFAGSFSMTEELENGYNQFNNPIMVTLQNLYLLIFKDRDSQTALGRGRVDGAGYIESGSTNSKGYMFGSTQDLQMKFLGIEDFWGNKLQWVDGLMSDSNWDILHGTGNFNDTGSGYSKQTTTASANISGYPMKVQGGKGGYVPADSSASETTGYADYGSRNASRLAYFGGGQGSGGIAGAFAVLLNYSASNSSGALSARLCYKNADAVYIGAYLGFEQSGKLRSISGNMPTDTKTISQFRTLAQANN